MILHPDKFLQLYEQYDDGKDVMDELLEELTPLAEATASSFCNDELYRRDLIQDCMVRAMKAMPNYNPTRAKPYNYFASVFRNICIYKVQKYNNNPTVPLHEVNGLFTKDIHATTLQDLIDWSQVRFSELAKDEQFINCVEYVYGMIKGKERPTKKHSAKFNYEYKIFKIIYTACLSRLRYINLHNTYYSYTPPEEISILTDLQEVVGETVYENLCMVFAGMQIRFPK